MSSIKTVAQAHMHKAKKAGSKSEIQNQAKTKDTYMITRDHAPRNLLISHKSYRP